MLNAKEQKQKGLDKKYKRLREGMIEWKANDTDKTFGEVCLSLSDIIQEMGGISTRFGLPRAQVANWEDVKQHILLLFIVNKERLRAIDLDNGGWKGYITRTINYYFHRAIVPTKKFYENTNSAGYSYNYKNEDKKYVYEMNERDEIRSWIDELEDDYK